MNNGHLNLPKRIHKRTPASFFVGGIEFVLDENYNDYWAISMVELDKLKSKPTKQLDNVPATLIK